jgi:hypothetical protein
MKTNLEIAISILVNGGSLLTSTGHEIMLDDDKKHLCFKAIANTANGSTEEIYLGFDISFDGFINEVNKMSNNDLWLKACGLKLYQ